MGRVTGADLDRRELQVEGLGPLGYDSLVVGAGAVTATFGVPGVAEHAFALKNLQDALDLRHHVLRRFERAALEPAMVEDGLLTVVIVGGGPTGVELAGGLAELFGTVLAKDFKRVDVRRARVVLVEMTDRVLGPFAPSLSAKALTKLRKLGRGGAPRPDRGAGRGDQGAPDRRHDHRCPHPGVGGRRGGERAGSEAGSGGRPRRADRGGTGPVGAGPPRGLRHRGRRRRHRRAGRAAAAAGAGGHAGRSPRGTPDRGPARGPPHHALPLPRQGDHGHHRPQQRRSRSSPVASTSAGGWAGWRGSGSTW